MYEFQIIGDMAMINIEDLIILLETRKEKILSYIDDDSSWNYGLEELNKQIETLKKHL